MEYSREPLNLWIIGIGKIGLIHGFFWLLLVFVYPKSPQVQALFFWNKWTRRFLGFGYVGFALTWVPYLRLKLFAPFKELLLADAALESFDPQAYFEQSEVMDKHSKPRHDILSTSGNLS